MKNTNDIKEQYNELKEEAQAYKHSLYKDYPQVTKFDWIFLLAAAWLTLPPQNWKYAEQSEALNLKIKEFTASLSNEKNR